MKRSRKALKEDTAVPEVGDIVEFPVKGRQKTKGGHKTARGLVYRVADCADKANMLGVREGMLGVFTKRQGLVTAGEMLGDDHLPPDGLVAMDIHSDEVLSTLPAHGDPSSSGKSHV